MTSFLGSTLSPPSHNEQNSTYAIRPPMSHHLSMILELVILGFIDARAKFTVPGRVFNVSATLGTKEMWG